MSNSLRYIIVADDSGHEYYIPEDKADTWQEWLALPEPECWQVPDWAVRIDGHFTFSDPRCE